MIFYHGDRLPGQFFDVLQIYQLVKITKAAGKSAAPGAARAADAVHICLRHIGKIKIDDKRKFVKLIIIKTITHLSAEPIILAAFNAVRSALF